MYPDENMIATSAADESSAHGGSIMYQHMRADICKGESRALSTLLPFVEVRSADLRSCIAHPTEGGKELRRLLSTHGLVVFKSADLSPRDEVQLAELSGYHKPFDDKKKGIPGGWNAENSGIATLPDAPEVLCQGNVLLEEYHGIASQQLQLLLTFDSEGFHSDGTHNMQTDLPITTQMYCMKAPHAGGETFFTCSRLAFSQLDAAMQDLCRRISVHYAYDEEAGDAIMRDGIVREGRLPSAPRGAGTDKRARGASHTVHPLVRTHPETGEESLYLSCANIERMEAPADEHCGSPAVYLDTVASYELVESLLDHVKKPQYVYAHKWTVGDLAIWDNRLLLHAPARAETCVGERLHHRVRLDGNTSANADLIEHALRRDLASAHTLSHHYKFDEVRYAPARACRVNLI